MIYPIHQIAGGEKQIQEDWEVSKELDAS
jgi:hypothetical protein